LSQETTAHINPVAAAKGVSTLIFEGSAPSSSVEEMMALVRRAALLDNLDKIKRVREIEQLFLVTNDPRLAEEAGVTGAVVILNTISPRHFHLGNRLKDLVWERELQKVLYFSGGGCPLISEDELRGIARLILRRKKLIYTNNAQSADLVAFTVNRDLGAAELPAADNSLAWALREYLGIEQELMPQSLGLLFDLDTPADVLVLGAGPFAGSRVREVIQGLNLDYSRLTGAKAVLKGHYQDVALIGRVGAPIVARLNSLLKVRLRVFSEERGMKALGRIESAQAISLLGLLLDHAGVERFFGYLAQVACCAFIDSRVLMAHYRLELSEEERFLSDLGQWREIRNPWLRRFTRAGAECEIPVVLGGHSLVAGGLWALSSELTAVPDGRGTALV